MPVSISGDGTFAGLTSVETVDLRHPDAVDSNIVLADDGSIALDSIPASIQSAIDGAAVAGIGSNAIQTVKTNTFSTTSTSFVDVTGLTVTITPSTNTSKILVVAQMTYSTARTSGTIQSAFYSISGGNSGTYIGDAASNRSRTVGGSYSVAGDGYLEAHTVVYLDSPGTTSPVTYAARLRVASGTVYINRTVNDSDNSGNPRGASSITAIEVAA